MSNGRSRRRFLGTLGTASTLAVAGCGSRAPAGDAEVLVENRTDAPVAVAVRILGDDGVLFDGVLTVSPDNMVSRHGLTGSPRRVQAFTDDGVSRTWQYDPDLPADFSCEVADVGLTVQDEGIEPWYDC